MITRRETLGASFNKAMREVKELFEDGYLTEAEYQKVTDSVNSWYHKCLDEVEREEKELLQQKGAS